MFVCGEATDFDSFEESKFNLIDCSEDAAQVVVSSAICGNASSVLGKCL